MLQCAVLASPPGSRNRLRRHVAFNFGLETMRPLPGWLIIGGVLIGKSKQFQRPLRFPPSRQDSGGPNQSLQRQRGGLNFQGPVNDS